jgi:predicted RNA-binding Zn-ribbon protein involved in translation (DUF1610 family)
LRKIIEKSKEELLTMYPELDKNVNQKGYSFRCICGQNLVDVNVKTSKFYCPNCSRELIVDWAQKLIIPQEKKSS